MILVPVDLVKNSRNVVELYKINKVKTAITTTVAGLSGESGGGGSGGSFSISLPGNVNDPFGP